MSDHQTLHPFSVFGHYEETGQIFVHHVQARNPSHAFRVVAEKYHDSVPTFVFKGHLSDGKDFECAGESLVHSETILEQEEVFS